MINKKTYCLTSNLGYNNYYKLAPLYDVVNTYIYGFEYSLGIALYKNNKRENFSEDELVKFLGAYVNEEELKEIKKIMQNKIKIYIENTPFEEFEKGEKLKNKLMKFFENRNFKIENIKL